ncbi:hypothetical protein CWRG_01941 [Chthonomonas calidirosea]|nr:hypothetical protein CWRG_01941 [Chthonomonas calidirosea]
MRTIALQEFDLKLTPCLERRPLHDVYPRATTVYGVGDST